MLFKKMCCSEIRDKKKRSNYSANTDCGRPGSFRNNGSFERIVRQRKCMVDTCMPASVHHIGPSHLTVLASNRPRV